MRVPPLRHAAARDHPIYVQARTAFSLAAAGDYDGGVEAGRDLRADVLRTREDARFRDWVFLTAVDEAAYGMCMEWRAADVWTAWTPDELGHWAQLCGSPPTRLSWNFLDNLGANLAGAVAAGDSQYVRKAAVALRDAPDGGPLSQHRQRHHHQHRR